jgi:hypothetical protein
MAVSQNYSNKYVNDEVNNMNKTIYNGRDRENPLMLTMNVPQYFIDDEMIAHHEKLTRNWLEASVYPYPIIEADQPWDSRVVCLFGTVFPSDEGGYRMYYASLIDGTHQDVLVATSEDDYSWIKPSLGITSWKGSKDNNITLSPVNRMDSPSMIFDEDDREYPYKMITFEKVSTDLPWGEGADFGLYPYKSSDGLHWIKMQETPCLRAGDRTNLMPTKQDGKFVMYTRSWDMFETKGKRVIYRSESENFIDWSELEIVLEPDLEDQTDTEFYGMSVFERNGWFFGLLEYWHSDRDVLETHLVVSRDGKKWSRTNPRNAFIAPTYDWNKAWSSCASNGPTIIQEQMVFYFGGRYKGHNRRTSEEHGVIGYASLEIDHFCSIEASAPGKLDTVPLIWPGGELVLNADTRESFTSHQRHTNGEITIEILDENGRPIPGWSGNERAIFQGNTHGMRQIIELPVTWPNGKKLDELRGKTIRLRFNMRHARLFTFVAKS